MRLFTITSASALALLLAASPVRAQDRWTAEVRGGANVNSNQFATTGPRISREPVMGNDRDKERTLSDWSQELA